MGIIRGAFHAAYLGHAIEQVSAGQGIMAAGLRCGIDYAFGELRLPRIMANYVPHNRPSKRLLTNLGFVTEGHAADYLLIDGRWQNHVLTSLTNRHWVAPTTPS